MEKKYCFIVCCHAILISSQLSLHGLVIKYHELHGFRKYLTEHPEIEEYVILDDCTFDFRDYKKLWERLLLTNGIERAKFALTTPAVETIIFMEYINFFENVGNT